ncbi:hypothetical protein X740_24720 [Mesorhizobium sp. LNHC221B00]|nr:hypothetical protein X740_24720 [Mesorhizobium sp. LNHC221B00]
MASRVLRTSMLSGFLRPNSLVHPSGDIAVGERRKQQIQQIVIAQGTEISWLTKADHTIGFPCQVSNCLLR